MPYWSPPAVEETAQPDPPAPPMQHPPPRDFGAEAKQRAEQRLAVMVTQLRNADPPNVLFEPEAKQLRNLCRILGLPLVVDRYDFTAGTVERITIEPPTHNVTG